MYIASCETVISHGILRYLPRDIRVALGQVDLSGAQEIRLRLGKPLVIHYGDGSYYIGKRGNLTALPNSALRVTAAQLEEAVELITASSVYSVKEEIKNGFVTVRGGHRVGIAGTAVMRGGRVDFIKGISGLCYRLASEQRGAADPVMSHVLSDGLVKNTLIISPPGAGKTTMLRDIARQLSYKAYHVSIADERREIAAVYDGRSPFDLGFNTDVLEGADKAESMLMLLRSMSPDVIVTDEIGTTADAEAIEKITNSGAAVIASIHGRDFEMIKKRADLSGMLGFFDVIVTLSRRNGAGTVEEITEIC